MPSPSCATRGDPRSYMSSTPGSLRPDSHCHTLCRVAPNSPEPTIASIVPNHAHPHIRPPPPPAIRHHLQNQEISAWASQRRLPEEEKRCRAAMAPRPDRGWLPRHFDTSLPKTPDYAFGAFHSTWVPTRGGTWPAGKQTRLMLWAGVSRRLGALHSEIGLDGPFADLVDGIHCFASTRSTG